MSAIRLAKYHATGNDFLVLSAIGEQAGVQGILGLHAAAVCDRRRGVGADGLLVLAPGSDGADCRMVLFNADGGVAEMSGNGIRCLAAEAVRHGLGREGVLEVATAAGPRTVHHERDDAGVVVAATVDMGPVTFEPREIPLDAPSPFGLVAEFHGVEYEGDAAGMGNPHLVLFVDDPGAARVTQHGPRLEVDPRFPRRTNVEFVAVTGPDELTMRVWERGVGETLSCGTGACATAAVAHRRGLVGTSVTVRVPGGDLAVALGATISLGGPVRHVFDVDVDIGALVEGT